uniref:SH3 domain-containing protein n=1 Tax=Meloidogyne hapla TaxID=6305 RepID=A0A1I8B7B3_MELHA
MTCNLLNNESELNSAFDSVSNSQTGDEWAIFGYDGTSSIVKLEAVGNGGLDQLLRSFNSSKTQYGFATVTSGAQRKVVLFHWQGEGVPAALLSSTTSHVEEIRRFVRRVNLTIYARNEEDLEKESSAGSSAIQPINNNINNIPFIPPTPANATNKSSVLHQEINLNEREKFWDEMRDEEELRRKEEANKRRQLQAQYAHEQQEMSEKLHKLHLERMEAQKQQQFGKSQSFDSSSINAGKMGKLISGRTQMFEQKVAELSESTKPLKKPKNFKWQVNLQKRLNTLPVNKVPEPPPKQFECVLKRKEIEQTKTVSEIKSQLSEQKPIINKIPIAPIPPVSQNQLNQQKQNNLKENENKNNEELLNLQNGNISPPPSEPTNTENYQQIIEENIEENNNNKQTPLLPSNEVKAKALWDYQAEANKYYFKIIFLRKDNTELTFNPDDIISDIQMVHDGWWYGRSPNGSVGLFPSNYVQLIQ